MPFQHETRIHPRSYKPTPNFLGGVSDRYFGIELEVYSECGTSRNKMAVEVMKVANGDGEHGRRMYCTPDCGFEMVSEPATIDYHLNVYPWQAVMEKCKELGLSDGSDNCSCGMHIHISRSAFGSTPKEQDVNLAKFIYLVEKHSNQLKKFSRRTARQIECYCNFKGWLGESPEKLYNRLCCILDRSYAVALNNRSSGQTIEVRLMKATLDIRTFKASLQILNHLVDLSIRKLAKEIESMTWEQICESASHYPELMAYLEECSLFTPQPQPGVEATGAIESAPKKRTRRKKVVDVQPPDMSMAGVSVAPQAAPKPRSRRAKQPPAQSVEQQLTVVQ